jgi:hypothetical protein
MEGITERNISREAKEGRKERRKVGRKPCH